MGDEIDIPAAQFPVNIDPRSGSGHTETGLIAFERLQGDGPGLVATALFHVGKQPSPFLDEDVRRYEMDVARIPGRHPAS